jgi:hypothetical protein
METCPHPASCPSPSARPRTAGRRQQAHQRRSPRGLLAREQRHPPASSRACRIQAIPPFSLLNPERVCFQMGH